MDAIEFFKEKERMCDNMVKCKTCPIGRLTNDSDLTCDEIIMTFPEEAIEIVKNWQSRETRQSKFLKIYPNAFLRDGKLSICPRCIEKDFACPERTNCITCRDKFWSEEIN